MTSVGPIIGVVLAGGLSRRMGGGAKGLIDLAGQSMIARVIAVTEPQVETIVINANGDAAPFAEFAYPVVADPIEGFVGPLAGVLAGLDWGRLQRPGTTHIATVPCDAPFLPDTLVVRLAEALAAAPDKKIALASSWGNLHPVCGLWPIDLADDLRAALEGGVRKVLHWTERHGHVAADFAPVIAGADEIDPFFNANTPEDIAMARRVLAEGARA